MYTVKGYCAGQCLFSDDVSEEALAALFEKKVAQLKAGQLQIQIGTMSLSATELCCDVYDERGMWLSEKSPAFK